MRTNERPAFSSENAGLILTRPASASSNRLPVAGNLGVNLQRPGIDSTGQVLDILKLLFLQKTGRLQAPDSHVAINDDLGGRVEFGITPGQLTQWDMHRPVQAVDRNFPRFPNIQEDDLFTLVQFRLDILRGRVQGRVRLKQIEKHGFII